MPNTEKQIHVYFSFEKQQVSIVEERDEQMQTHIQTLGRAQGISQKKREEGLYMLR